ncbi:YajG family lipoprotein [Pseudoalteromonas spongiae]|uniref:YajG family lipoprotein n=1 Tax=Pseudoalteromonas spongiae TaxID=298657 RepID=UPI00110B10B2|nr:YajG family lipoprotein [Pseudoalteromonas spongiae]TMO85311.1 hypothetical protein CWC15_08845 [Pseudoalteromonas spongiae]
MNAKYKVTVLALTLGFLAGCSTPSQKFIFSPNYTQTHQKMVQQDVSLSVNDRRASFTTVTIKDSDGNQTLADKYLAESITPAIEQALAQVGANNSGMGKALDVNIQRLDTTIKQQLHKHTTITNAELEVVIETTEHRFAKRYKGNKQSEAPLGFDKAKVEQQVNRLIEEMITRIVTDPEFVNAVNR